MPWDTKQEKRNTKDRKRAAALTGDEKAMRSRKQPKAPQFREKVDSRYKKSIIPNNLMLAELRVDYGAGMAPTPVKALHMGLRG